jgi:hypothetical protein
MKFPQVLPLLGAIAALGLSGCNQEPPQPAAVQGPPAESATPAAQPATPTIVNARFEGTDIARVQGGGRTACALDKADGQAATGGPVTLNADEVELVGWVATAARQVPGEFEIVLQNDAAAYSAVARANQPRADVAKSLQSDALANSGFHVVAATDAVAPGTYAVSIRHAVDGNAFDCPTASTIVVN